MRDTRVPAMADGGVNTADYLLSTGAPDDIAIVDGTVHYRYDDLRRSAAMVARAIDELGLQTGSKVALIGPNSLFWVAGYLAVMKLGLVVVPLADKSTPEDVRVKMDAVGCTAVLADRRVLRRHATAFCDVRVLTDEILDSPTPGTWPDLPTCADDDAVLMFTSGTTSTAKAVRVTHRNLQANTSSIVTYLGLRCDDRVLVVLPFFYCYGASLLHTHLRVGARLVLCSSFVFPEVVIDQLEHEECTVFAGVPSSFQLLLRAGSFATRSLPSLRLIQQAGGKLSPALIDELVAARPHSRVFVMYGQTEATARLSYLPPERLKEKLGSIGRGIPGVELRVLDEAGRPVRPGERGEIYARGENVSPGYFGDPEGSAPKFTEHGLRTGDLAVVDEEGFIFIVDRREDFIKSWGYRISSQEIEASASHHADVVAAAAIGVPDERAGEAVMLFVSIRPGSTTGSDDVLAFLGTALPRHMAPQKVVVLDSLPLNANGKVAKSVLRELAMNGSTF
jgi:long-chain acyl-CoA synthetase